MKLQKISGQIKKWWRWIVGIVGVIVAVFVFGKIKKAVIDAVSIKRNHREVMGKPGSIEIQSGNEWVEVKLPAGVSAQQVESAGISGKGEWAVEVKHETTDRRGDASIGRNSDMGL